jgi:hypothetical protein
VSVLVSMNPDPIGPELAEVHAPPVSRHLDVVWDRPNRDRLQHLAAREGDDGDRVVDLVRDITFPACCETVTSAELRPVGIVASTFPVAASKTATLLSVLFVTHTVPCAPGRALGALWAASALQLIPLTARPTVANTLILRFMASLLLDCCESPEEV